MPAKISDLAAEIHLELEQLLDPHRRKGTSEAVIKRALERAIASSAMLIEAGQQMGVSGGARPPR